MSFGFVQIETSSPQITFTSTTSLWPSSFRAEAMAILSSIITVPKDATIDIFTDSKSSIDIFNHLKSNNFRLSTHQTLKIMNNLHIWNIICEIMTFNNLQVELHHVKAHSKENPDQYNDYIDQQCKNVHNDSNSSVLTISTKNLKNLKYSLR